VIQHLHRIILVAALALLAGACSKEDGKAAAGGSLAPQATPKQAGEKLFRERCLECHKIDGKGGVVGPDLTGIAAKRSRAFLEQVIREPSKTYPGTVMPPGDNFSAQQINQLVDYLSGLR